jgi:hypothetical protein
MRIVFSGYAPDCTVTADIDLEGDRLADFLATAEEVDVDHARLEALDDGHVVEVESATLLLDDLCLVSATGPRGRQDRRVWTRQLPARARVGPYEIRGYIHGPPTIDPFRTADRREIVALTSSVIEYKRAGELVRDEVEVALLNRRKIDLLEPISSSDMGMANGPDPVATVDPRSKDLTGDVLR